MRETYGTPFRPITWTNIPSQELLYQLVSSTEVPVGGILWYSRGYEDNGDCFILEIRECKPSTLWHGDLDYSFMQTWYQQPFGLPVNEEVEEQLYIETISMYCMGGEL
jgi:hypothetical protein